MSTDAPTIALRGPTRPTPRRRGHPTSAPDLSAVNGTKILAHPYHVTGGWDATAFDRALVHRPALVQRLVAARDAPLALIVAPAGYGKSTLLAQWAQRDERQFIWVTLDPRDEVPEMVVASIVEAFAETGWTEMDADATGAWSLAQDPTAALQRLLCSRQCRSRPFVLVLDDGHAIPPAVLTKVMPALLRRLRPGSQVALASRTEPPIGVSRLRASRALVEIRARDLAMSDDESLALLELAGLTLEPASARVLAAKTEGWPAALYLAALALRDHDDPAAAVKRFTGEDHRILDYVRDECLGWLPSAASEFLVRASALDEPSALLCDDILEREESAVILAQLAHANLVLRAVESGDCRYRWHPLFRDVLRSELRAEPAVQSRLHRRASTWYQQHGDVGRAVSHAVAADDAKRAGDLLWTNLMSYVGRGRIDVVQGWLRGFADEQIADYGPLALAAAHCSLAAGDLPRAHHLARAATEAWRRDPASATNQSLQAGLEIIQATAPGVGAVQMGRAAARAYDLEPIDSPWRTLCCLLRGAAELLTGNDGGAHQQLEEGAQLGAVAAPIFASLCLAELVIIAIDHEDWELAGELAQRATRELASSGTSESSIAAIVLAAAAACRAREGRADEAKRDLRQARNLLARLSDFMPWYGVQTRLLLARAALGVADTVAARTLLAEASRLARRAGDVVVFQRCFDQAWAEIDALAESALSGPSSLTIAELRILRFLPSHESFREIADRLGVSVNTVKTQAHAIYRKLDATSRSEAVRRAHEAGLLGT